MRIFSKESFFFQNDEMFWYTNLFPTVPIPIILLNILIYHYDTYIHHWLFKQYIYHYLFLYPLVAKYWLIFIVCIEVAVTGRYAVYVCSYMCVQCIYLILHCVVFSGRQLPINWHLVFATLIYVVLGVSYICCCLKAPAGASLLLWIFFTFDIYFYFFF